MNLKGKTGKILILTGLLLFAAAFSLSIYNLREDREAEKNSGEILSELQARIRNTELSGEEEKQEAEAQKKESFPEMPDIEMPTMEINGQLYIGILEIPSLGLELPVQADWNYPALQRSPCRYKGSLYSRDMILAAHNYTSHFGLLKTLLPGDSVNFTDARNCVFQYEVADMEIMPGTAVSDMEAGDWDMTLFTCVFSGTKRVAVRCTLI